MKSYFDILEIEESFDIDQNILEEKYFDCQTKYHPDRAKSEEEKNHFNKVSTILNIAYKNLKDDLLRATHILEINDIHINSESKAPKVPIEILEEILEIQEKFENGHKEEIVQIAKEQCKEIILNLSDLFKARDYSQASIKAIQLKYLKNILSKSQN